MRITIRYQSIRGLEAISRQLADTTPTYPEVGATNTPDSLPAGYTHDRKSVRLGDNRRSYELGVQALFRWQAHRALGARLTPATPPIKVGQLVLAVIPLGPLKTVVPCPIVYVTDKARRFGFAYGTLPGHPERGEESFHVVEKPSGEVVFEIVAFSRPADLLGQLGSHVARRIQIQAMNTYLEGVRQYVEMRR